MTRKTHDLCVKTGTYQAGGVEKARYQTVGAVMQGDDGRSFILLEAWFNPAGLERQAGRSSVLLSMFEPRQDGGQQQRGGAETQRWAMSSLSEVAEDVSRQQRGRDNLAF